MEYIRTLAAGEGSKIKNDIALKETEVVSVICPSRRRPEQLKLMISSCLEKSSNPKSIQFCIYIDRDDFSYEGFEKNFPGADIKFLQGPRLWLSSMYNALLTQATGDYILWLGDDVKFQTNNWDIAMKSEIRKFPKNLGVVHVNDKATSYKQIYATIGMVHRNWIDVFGYVFTPHLRDNGIDFWITNVANQVKKRTYLSDVVVEHMQYRQGKSTPDSTYLDRLNNHKLYNPQDVYRRLRDERRRDSLLLSEHIGDDQILFSFRYTLSWIYLRISKPTLNASNINTKRVYVGGFSNLDFFLNVLKKITKLKFRERWD